MSDTNPDTDAAVDLNDPGSWPTDAAGLAGLAVGEDAAETKAPAPEAPAAEKSAVADDAKPAVDAKGVADLGGKDDPEGVLTRDGKHIIPFQVLKNERDARMALETQTAALTEEVTALRAAAAARTEGTGQAEEGKDKPAAAAGDREVPAEVKAKAEELRENYGDEFADSWLENWHTKAELAAVTAWMKTVEGERATAESATRRTAEEDMQAAIDAVPLLAEWQVDKEHPEWYGAANEVHRMLMKSSAAYKAMPVTEQMALLPEKVEALYGESPHSATTNGKAETTKIAAGLIKSAAVRRPASMTDIPGGDPPAASEAERLEAMTPAQLQATIDNVAAKGTDKLETFLRGLQ